MTRTPITKILIANRGEIAARIARTARAMGLRTVAVYSDADACALHVSLCDEAVPIGPAPVAESYLNIEALIRAARRTGADAVHPGYGFLSENAAFAEACASAGLVFIGPPAEAIAAMGNKAAAKRRMIEAAVPCVPGYQGADQTDATLSLEAQRIGFPIMVKAAAGGGGRGMRLATTDAELTSALVSARSEAEHAFGSGELILEKAVTNARHVEIQIFADVHGHTIHLGERDCSVQRRHQKVIEEAPSPAVSPALRAAMGAAAVKAAASIGYVGAGTVEFLLGADGTFYFLEMNTRLQVEHPVTELITGFDLVEWQIRVARGEPLPVPQDGVRLDGHAIEVRLYAESPQQGFLPQSGDVMLWDAPTGLGVRADGGLHRHDHVSPHYDPMIAKVMAHGATRDEARQRLTAALRRTALLGIETNQAFLLAMLDHPEFAAGAATTAFIGTHFPPGSTALQPASPRADAIAAAAALALATDGESGTQGALTGWSSTGLNAVPVHLDVDGTMYKFRVTIERAGIYAVQQNAGTVRVGLPSSLHAGAIEIDVDGRRSKAHVAVADGRVHLAMDGRTLTARDRLREPRITTANGNGGQLLAPMNGRVVRLGAKVGDAVTKGQCIVVIEAMKMQHEITAPRTGRLVALNVVSGQQVATRAVLAEVA
jgi:geranyl-CoA carboxylase alpha subunit